MDLNEYQRRALLTNIYPEEYRLPLLTLKLNGEAGEVAEKVAKAYRDHAGCFSAMESKALARELGDVLWYVAVLAKELGYDLEGIGVLNLAKLRDRQERGVLGGSGDER
jgi:NTP pyrophosphatase (non-canonical NTP hydrolase)